MKSKLVGKLQSVRAAVHDAHTPSGRFGFWRWFMALSLLIIVINSALLAWLLASYIEEQMLERDVVVSMEFVDSIVRVQKAVSYFHGDTMNPSAPEMEEFFRHVANLPDVIRANVYGGDRSILWSSDPSLIGHTFGSNDELEQAFAGNLHPEIKDVQRGMKEEHVNFPKSVTRFIENYLPIWSTDRTQVVGVVEQYKAPEKLLSAIHKGQMYVWGGSLLAAAFLYGGLAVVVLYAKRILREQQMQNVEMERLAVVGEMASAVAHGLRNPLAAIRSCAELALDDDLPPESRQPIADIVTESDRLESWIRSFLTRSRQESSGQNEVTQIDSIVKECLLGFSAQLQARQIKVVFQAPGASPLVLASRSELSQVLNSIISNAIEAMQHDGELTVTRDKADHGMVCVTFFDTGPGIPKELLGHVFKPFVTTKTSGLGIGMALARRITERLGGTLELANQELKGAEVRVLVPAFQGPV